MISARALGVYMYLQASGAPISAESLSKVFNEGRDAIGSALSELKDLTIISSKKERIGNRIITVNTLVDPDYWALETRLLISLYVPNSRLSTNSLLAIKQTEYLGAAEDEYKIVNLKPGGAVDFPSSYDPDDLSKDRERSRMNKYLEKENASKKRYEQRMQRRSGDPSNWSVTDTAFEFANGMHELWHVKPWSVTTSRFRIALADARSTHGTTGDVEKLMIDLYFKQIKHDTKIDDPEIIWKRFIMQFNGLKIQAERFMVTPEDMKHEKELARKSQEWMDNV